MCMATMASTSHGLSVWANTCVKSPINPKTGQTASLHDRGNFEIKYDVSRNVEDAAHNLSSQENEGIVAERMDDGIFVSTVNARSEYDHLRASHDGDFYGTLQLLKEENRKTLEAYERLYNERILDENAGTKLFQKKDKSGVDIRTVGSNVDLSVIGLGTQAIFIPDEIIVKKPPQGKSGTASLYRPTPSKKLPKKSIHSSILQRPNSAPTEQRSHSLDDEYWHQVFFKSRESSNNFTIPLEQDHSNEYESALAKVDKLWKDFKISEYTQRRHSFSSSNKNDTKKSEDTQKEWRHRITIPQPFKMSIRDALKEKKKTPAQEELEQRRLAKQRQEEAECEKKFKAQPVPSHVYLPKYEEIMERNETRRKYIKQICQELLQSQVTPFNFEIREKEKKSQKAFSAPVKRPDRNSNNFKAQPVPKHIFSQDINEKLLEEEEMRKIRVKMRSKELLRESSLPPSMAAREMLKEQEKRVKMKKTKSATKKQPRRAHSIPDFEALYNQFKKDLERRRLIQTGTVVEPFILETERIQSNKDKIQQDIEEDKKRLKDNRWPFQNSRMTQSSMKYLGALSNSMDYIPTLTTKSAELRSSRIQKERERIANRNKNDEEAERRKRTREAKLRRYLSEKITSADIPKPRDSIAERLKKMRQEDRERQEAYEKEIEEMNAKVEKSPLLVEKFMAETAKRKAEKKFTSALQNVGLDDTEFVRSMASRPPSAMADAANGDSSGNQHAGDPDDHCSDASADYQGPGSADQHGNDSVPGDGEDSHHSNSDRTFTKSASGD